MKQTAIAAYETSFFNTGVDSAGKKHLLAAKSLIFPGDSNPLQYTLCTPESGDKSFYLEQEIPKDQIVLHFTMGYVKGDVATLTKTGKTLSVPFIIARNGKIINLWSSKYWSYHLGPGAIGGNSNRSPRTIGIEISNIGPLKKIGSNLVTTYSDTDIYCPMTETGSFSQSTYRNYQYWATYTDAQIASTIKLLRFLTQRYDIPREFLPEAKRYQLFKTGEEDFPGIVSHVNYRTDKVDIGPAFPWQRVIAGVSA